MKMETLSAIAPKLLSFPTVGREITILWHAGEPLVLPVEYYKQAISILESSNPGGVNLSYAFVTNGTRIDEKWVEFFRCHNVKVGVSLDGPQFIHDQQRVTRSGKGTFAATMRGIDHFRSGDFPFYVISVLTSTSLNYPEEMYNFYAANRIKSVCFNIDEVEGPHTISSMAGPGSDASFRRFLSEFLSLATNFGVIENVREISNLIGRIRALSEDGHSASRDNDQTRPFGMINVDTAGNISTFSPELLTAARDDGETFLIGNLVTDSVSQIMESPTLRRMSEEIERGVENCRASCGYFDACGGGAPSNKFFETGSFESTETIYCRLTQQVACDVVLDVIDGFCPEMSQSVQAAP
jgi:uncharacterized protein